MVKKKNEGKKSQKTRKLKKWVAILALILNIVLISGLGTVIGRMYKVGIIQIVIALIGAWFTELGIPSLTVIGFVGLFLAWVWGIFSGIELIKSSE